MRTFHAGSDVGEDGPWCKMARNMACCAHCRVNLRRAGGWTNVAPRRSLISVHWDRDELLGVHGFVIVMNYWESTISSSWCSASSLSNSRSSPSGLHGVVVVWIVAGEHHLHSCRCTEDAVSEGSDGFSSLAIGGDLGRASPGTARCRLLCAGRARRLVVFCGSPTAVAGFSRSELLATRCAGGALALVGLGLDLRADRLFSATASIASAWSGHVMSCVSGGGVSGLNGMSTSSARVIESVELCR